MESFGYILKRGIAGSCGSYGSSFIRKLHAGVQWKHQFIVSPAVSKCLSFPTFTLVFGIIWVFCFIIFLSYSLWLCLSHMTQINHTVTPLEPLSCLARFRSAGTLAKRINHQSYPIVNLESCNDNQPGKTFHWFNSEKKVAWEYHYFLPQALKPIFGNIIEDNNLCLDWSKAQQRKTYLLYLC